MLVVAKPAGASACFTHLAGVVNLAACLTSIGGEASAARAACRQPVVLREQPIRDPLECAHEQKTKREEQRNALGTVPVEELSLWLASE